jgi:choline dehydrogenase
VASRLSEDARNKVLVLEAGGSDWEPFYRIPLMGGKMYSYRRNNWFYHSTPQSHCCGRRIFLPRGCLVGGTFNINGIVYMRGARSDFDRWSALGNTGWSFAEVLPYFKRTEGYKHGASRFHSVDGPLPVAECTEPNITSRLWVKAGIEAGYGENADPNGEDQSGFGLNHHNVWKGRRWTTARALLLPALSRPNLRLITRAMVRRIRFEGKRAKGVEYEQGSEPRVAHCNREIILAAGAFNSPKLMMLSGVGDETYLRQLGVPVTHHLPAVGRSLQDHYNVTIGQAATQPVTLAADLQAHRMTWNLIKAWLWGKGPAAVSPIEAGAFLRIDPAAPAPEIQVAFTSIFPDHARLWFPGLTKRVPHSYGACLWPNRPFSRGDVKLASTDLREHPLIDPKFLSDERDLQTTRTGIRLVRKVLAQPAFGSIRGEELAPGASCQSDQELDDFARRTGPSGHHACGSMRMGIGSDSVVDPQLRVHGLDGVRVADASIMPEIVSGNTNATTIMIGEKASDLILGRELRPEKIEANIYA